jgi:hypothetical protein
VEEKLRGSRITVEDRGMAAIKQEHDDESDEDHDWGVGGRHIAVISGVRG